MQQMDLFTQATLSFEIEKKVLADILKRVMPVVQTKSDIPILSNFLLKAANNTLTVLGSNISQHVFISSTSNVDIFTPGKAVIPASKFYSIVNEVPPDELISISIMNTKAYIGTKDVAWELAIQKYSSYPKINIAPDKTCSISKKEFLRGLELVRFAASRDLTKPSLTSISCKDNIMTACDTYRLQRAKLSIEMPNFNIPIADYSIISKTLIASESELFKLGLSDSFINFQDGSSILTIPNNGIAFPDVEKIILRPALENTYELTFNRKDLILAAKRAKLTTDDACPWITMELLPGKIEVSSKDRSGGRTQALVLAKWAGSNYKVTVNYQHLIDCLNSHNAADITILLGKDSKVRKSPLLIKNEEEGLTSLVHQSMEF